MHSHNDYDHSTPPLCTALGYGAASAEADVYYDGPSAQLLLKHGPNDPVRGTLIDKYLAPLWQRYNERPAGRKWLYPGWPRPFTLVVEIKDTAPANDTAIDALQVELASYLPMLTTVSNGKVTEGMVTVLLTGQANANSVRTNPVQDTFVNLTDDTFLDEAASHTLPNLSIAPLVNVEWCHVDAYLRVHASSYQPDPNCRTVSETKSWKRLDSLNLQSYAAVADKLATMAHDQGLKIRWWGVPDESETDGIWTTNRNYLDNEILNGLDYVSANSTESSSAAPDFGDVSDELISLGDGCSGAQECALGAKATVAVNQDGGQLQVSGTLWATDPSECASLQLKFFLPGHTIDSTVKVPQVCGTTPKPWGVTVAGAPGAYAAVGLDLQSTQLYHDTHQITHDFYYL
ncbi:hypothetical protein [Amycolatopsis pigmentata]|uniref:Uncharacterized protein n=1 Tax=Amycolatopsis pigmentata TaxID=450801 RepID=A0ABW5FXN6_9PSEU